MLESIYEAIKEAQTIIIHRHLRPDGDCIGAQIGLKYLIKENFREKEVYAVGEIDEKLSFIGEMDSIEQDSYREALVIILDTANQGRISDERYKTGQKIIRIDHHPKVETIGDIEWIDPSYTSVCEMIVHFFNQFSHLKLSKEGRAALYYGIITDTNRFLNPSTSKQTFDLASTILTDELDLFPIYQNIYGESLEIFRLRGYVMNHLIVPGTGLGYFVLDKELCRKYGVDSSITNTLANSISHVEGVNVWFIAVEDINTSKVRISLRSDQYPIDSIAEHFGGGGHPHASGLMLEDVGVIPNLVHAIGDYLNSIKGGH